MTEQEKQRLATLLWRASRIALIAAYGGTENGYGRETFEDDWIELADELYVEGEKIHRPTMRELGAAFGEGDKCMRDSEEETR